MKKARLLLPFLLFSMFTGEVLLAQETPKPIAGRLIVT